MWSTTEIDEIVGKTIQSVIESDIGDDILAVQFEDDPRTFVFGHYQDCCESVWLEEGFEDLKDLEGSVILSADEEVNYGGTETGTWTFYKIQTDKGFAHLRFCGESNGYYSEYVDLYWRD